MLERPGLPLLAAVEEAEDGLRDELLVGLELGGAHLLPVGGVGEVGDSALPLPCGAVRERVARGARTRSSVTTGTGARGGRAPVVELDDVEEFEAMPKRGEPLLLLVVEAAAHV